jgi:zinc transport system permease protein
MLILALVVVIIILSRFSTFFRITFDEEYARASGINTNRENMILISLAAVSIGLAIQIIGSLLVGGLMVIPVNIALTFKTNFKRTIIISIIAAEAINISGILLSFALNLPSGATIILVGILAYLCCLLLRRN